MRFNLNIIFRFIQSIGRYNGAQVDSFEWPEPERKINAWVNQLTEGEIPQLLQPGSIPQETILFLLNAVYFEVWAPCILHLLVPKALCVLAFEVLA